MQEEKENKLKNNLKTLRTYQGDVEEAIGSTKASVTTIAVAEQERKLEERPIDTVVDNSNKRNKMIMLFASVLIVIGLASVVYIYYMKSGNIVVESNHMQTIIGYTDKFDINISSTTTNTLLQTILKEKTAYNKPINSVLFINMVSGSNIASSKEVIAKLIENIPQPILRNLDEDYMIGLYTYDTNVPFIIMTTNDYGASFAGMLKWEETMPNDLAKIFDTNTESATSSLVFVDESVKNKDLRVLFGNDGKAILVYTFLDKKTILITKNEKIMTEILGKFINNQIVR